MSQTSSKLFNYFTLFSREYGFRINSASYCLPEIRVLAKPCFNALGFFLQAKRYVPFDFVPKNSFAEGRQPLNLCVPVLVVEKIFARQHKLHYTCRCQSDARSNGKCMANTGKS